VKLNRELGKGLNADIWAERVGYPDVAIEVRYKTSRG
jgi:hypothetical protein